MKQANSIVKPKMAGLNKIAMIRGYCDYLESHLNNVARAWIILQEALPHEKIIWNDYDFWMTNALIEDHDLSKTGSKEFTQYAEWFFSKYGKDYDLWDDGGNGESEHKKLKMAFDKAWAHHKSKNQHHWETILKSNGYQTNNNPAWNVVCMVADWMAMSFQFGGTAEEYYAKNKEKFDLPEWVTDMLKRIFIALKKTTMCDKK